MGPCKLRMHILKKQKILQGAIEKLYRAGTSSDLLSRHLPDSLSNRPIKWNLYVREVIVIPI
ncbi:MAG: hypothetical protein DRN03_06345 [Thermoplasmata archaeon]|nr:MAG: hypothetical protein DRN03_06345 [Thermoplasmata archaeon]